MDATAAFDASQPNWYALHTRSRHEKIVRDRLEGSGIEPFLPLRRELRRWSDRRTVAELPLFSGYCFARFPLNERTEVLQIPGIVTIVGNVGPEPIPVEEMDALMAVSSSQRLCNAHHDLTEGTLVEVVRGPLAGIRGKLVRKAGQDCIVIRVQLLQQAAAVHIDASEVVAVC
jgi:transcription antitermination factor NusG